MDKKDYSIANLSNETVQQVRSLEETLNKEADDEVILIAYQKEEE